MHRLGYEPPSGSQLSWALTAEGFLDFYRMARANATCVKDRGSALFETHACFNHACDANAVVVRMLDIPTFADSGKPAGAIAVFTTRAVALDEELCIDYLGYADVEDVRIELQCRYGFVCTCSKCQSREG